MRPSLTPNPVLARRSRDEHELFQRYRRDRDPATRDALVERFMPLARHLANRYPPGADRDDLQQVASLGLLKAIDRFDPDHGSAFSSFATPTILGELKRYFRDYGWTVRAPRTLQELTVRIERATEDLTAGLGRAPTAAELSELLGASVEDVLEALTCASARHPIALDHPAGDGDRTPPADTLAVEEAGFARVEQQDVIDSLLEVLSERERLVVKLRFCDELLQREIAEHLGVSQMHVSRLLARAIATLTGRTATRDGTITDHAGRQPREPGDILLPAATT